MRETSVPGYRLSRARISTRVLISLGMLGLLLGLLSASSLTIARTGVSARSVTEYYLGTNAADSDSLDEVIAPSSPRPFDELAEVTHLHLMGGSLMLFLLCHLLSLCNISDRLRTLLYLASFVSFLVTFTTPWLIIYLSPAFAYVFGPVIIFFVISLVILCLLPLREMWLPSREAGAKNNLASLEELTANHGSAAFPAQKRARTHRS